jgi:transcriptional regulator with XRE-family HTH domain
MSISAAQCRGARAMLQISQHALAEASGVSARAIADFEAENRKPIRATAAALRRALEEAGVEFTDSEQPGVQLKKRKAAKR